MAIAVKSDFHTKLNTELIEKELDSFLSKNIHQLDEIAQYLIPPVNFLKTYDTFKSKTLFISKAM